jgi:tripartite-type tricarboxylate transporter receptor subunit TctC
MTHIPPHLSRRACVGRIAALALGAGLAPARAQPGWPSRPLTLVVPWPAGNPTDGITRRMQPLLNKALGQATIVENIAGAGGTLGAARVMVQPADGHTVLMGTPTELILSPLQMPAVRYAAADFSMVGLLGRVPYVLAARADLPQATLADVVALAARADARPLTIGNIGPGSLIHIIATQFAKVSGVSVTHVPYRGVPPMVQDLLGGQLDLAFVPVNGATLTSIEQGKLRSLGITAAAAFPLFPSLEPMAAGHRAFAGFDFDVWGGMFVPKAVPQAVQARLNQVFYEATHDAGFREWARATGTPIAAPMSLAELEAAYAADIRRYQALARALPVTN